MTRGLLAQLSPHEEVSLRRIAMGDESDRLPETHLRRLQTLNLIELQGGSWGLTPLGRKRHAALARPFLLRSDGQLSDEIDRILKKYTKEAETG